MRSTLLRMLLCFMAGAAWIPSTFSAESEDEYLHHLTAGREAIADSRHHEAIESFEIARQLGGARFDDNLAELAWLYAEVEDPHKAVEIYEELFQLSLGETERHLRLLTDAYRQAGLGDHAPDACLDFIAQAPDDARRAFGYNELGYWLLQRDGDGSESLEEAQGAFREAVQLSDGRADNARLNLAETLRRRGQIEQSDYVIGSLVWLEDSRPWSRFRLLEISAAVSERAEEARRQLASRPRTAPGAGVSRTARDQPARILHVSGDVLKPEILSAPVADYTTEARRAGIQGVVIAQAVIDETGKVTSVRVLKDLSHGLTEQAVEAMKRWRFAPATLGGEPVAVYFNLTVSFKL